MRIKMKTIHRFLTLLSLMLIWQASWAISADLFEKTDNSKLQQFSSSGHIVGFKPGEIYVAAMNHALKVKFIDANAVIPTAPESTAKNLDSNQQESKVQAFTQASYKQLWQGIDLDYTPGGGIIQSTYTLKPGARVDDIVLQYNVPIAIQKNGQLQLTFETGQLTESAPIAWQVINGQKIAVEVGFKQLAANNQLGFQVGEYNPAQTLYIDPTLTWHTFLGGTSSDVAQSLSLDSDGNIYVAGYSNADWGSPVNGYSGGADMVVAKLDTAGALQWHTFLGGTSSDYAQSLSLDSSGNIYVSGYSYADWGGMPVNAHSGTHYDMVIAKLNTAGGLLWHTFLGGTSSDYAQSLSLDSDGNIYVAGYSYADWGGMPENTHSGNADMVIAKLNTAGVLQWHTFLGGTSSDIARSLSLDSDGNIYVAGNSSVDWGLPVNGHSGNADMVVAKLNTAGALLWHTFLGGTNSDVAQSLSLDSDGNIYVAGYSNADWGGLPVNAYSGSYDMVIAKLNTAGALQWHTFLGGTGYDIAYSLSLDSSGNLYVAGRSNTDWGSSPLNAHSGSVDMVIAKLDTAGALQWHTFLGGTSSDIAHSLSLSLDSSGNLDNLYVAGYSSANWGSSPVNGYSGSADIVVAKLTPILPGEINLLGNTQTIANDDTIPSTADDTDFVSVNVNSGDQTHTFTIQNSGAGTLTLTGTPSVAISGTNASDFTVTTQPASASIAASGNTSFIVTFDPSSVGLRTATVSISNDDSTADPYTFSIQGAGVVPEINLQGNGQDIINGDTTPSTEDDTDFSEVFVSEGSETHTFTLQNTGTDTLNLTGTPLIEISGSDADDFSISTEPADSITPADNTTFVVTFNPSATGLRTATLSISNDDSTAAPFVFALQGRGKASISEPPSSSPVPPTIEDPTPPVTENPLKFVADTETNGQQAVVDLTTDIEANNLLIDHIRNTPNLTAVENAPLDYKLDPQTGLLHGQWKGLDTKLRPVSVTEKDSGERPGITTTEEGHVQFITENGRKIIFQVEAQAFDDLTEQLEQFDLRVERDAENNLQIFQRNSSGSPETDNWFNVRPGLLSEPVNGDAETIGVENYEYPDLPGVFGYYHQFIKEDQLYRQYMHAMPVDWSSLKNYLNSLPGAETVSISVDGEIFVRLDGTDYFGRMDAKVNPVETSRALLDETYLINMGDVNGDGRVDYKIVFPNGEWQILYLLR